MKYSKSNFLNGASRPPSFSLYFHRWMGVKMFSTVKNKSSQNKRIKECSNKQASKHLFLSPNPTWVSPTSRSCFFLLFLQAATRSKLTTYMINSHFVSQLLLRMQACAANLLSVNWAVPLNMQAWLSDWVFHSPITQISSRMWFSLGCVFKFNKCQGNLMDQVVAKPAKRGTLPLLSLFLQGDNRECL